MFRSGPDHERALDAAIKTAFGGRRGALDRKIIEAHIRLERERRARDGGIVQPVEAGIEGEEAIVSPPAQTTFLFEEPHPVRARLAALTMALTAATMLFLAILLPNLMRA